MNAPKLASIYNSALQMLSSDALFQAVIYAKPSDLKDILILVFKYKTIFKVFQEKQTHLLL